MNLLFGRYDAVALGHLMEEASVFDALRQRGFGDFEIEIAEAGYALPHIRLRGRKAGASHLLLEACLRRVSAPAEGLQGGSSDRRPLDLLLVHWVREEDPTAAFTRERPALPLQNHPGLGILRRAFRIAVHLAQDLRADGVCNRPKFFHDGYIFHRSRLFLFLDGAEQGRFEALVRDLAPLPLRQASLAVAGWCVRDARGELLRWEPGYQAFPLSERLTGHFHAPAYAAAVEAAREQTRYTIDLGALERTRAELGEA
jgi:hypothetical protein